MGDNTGMKTSLILATLLGAGALGGCDGERVVRISTSNSEDTGSGVLKVVDTLQCPDTQGGLTRKGAVSPDGTICTYGGPKGAEITLHLVKLDGMTAEQALKAFEERLGRDLPEAADKVRAQETSTQEAMSGSSSEMATGSDAAHISAPGMHIDAKDDQASVRLPGLRVEADGDRASVRIAGFQIRADDHGAAAQSSTGSSAPATPTPPPTNQGGVTINARDDATEVRTRAGGEAVRMTYVLTNNQASAAGWRMVGYEARGPAGGPLVVATVRAKSERVDPVFRDAKRLVSLNVGD
ncbi:methyltransferase type 11 [Brevundimonas sp. Leaf363]|uniref:methyltransferase type 11 n=1 Tax=Brevundimonas sp. Leaf363 TaxID=1736353 RepID=UPI000A50F082|nr:methyltransferase type 11 [Brevundimonas sp. Leaf363]